MNTYNPDPGKGYRLLEEWEQPMEGDEHAYGNGPVGDGSGYGWVDYLLPDFRVRTVGSLRQHYYGLSGEPICFRRAVPAIDPGEGYRLVDNKTEDVLYKDELLTSDGVWRQAYPVKVGSNPDITFRRKVSTFKVSDTGEGIYETRDGQHLLIVANQGYSGWEAHECPWESLHIGAWYDNGRFFEDREHPNDLIYYVGPIPKWEPTEEFRAIPQRLWVKGDETEWRNV